MDHIMLDCPFAKEVWLQAMNLNQATKLPHYVQDLLSSWVSLSPFRLTKEILLQTAWEWLPKAICWKLWLERNNRIFRNQDSPPQKIVVQARAILGEALESNLSLKNSTQLLQDELCWLSSLTPNLHPRITRLIPQSEQWEIRLEEAAFRRWKSSLNEPCLFFNGASKGNPGSAGAGGVISLANGNMLSKYAWGLGIESNNAAEFCGLWQGLKIARAKGIDKILVFGDSRLLINALITKKSPPHIKLSHIFHKIVHLSKYFQVIRYFHVSCELNKQADKEANKGSVLDQSILCTDGDYQRCDIP